MNRNPEILFDHRMFSQQTVGGVSRYIARLIAHLPEFGVSPKVFAPFSANALLAALDPALRMGPHMKASRAQSYLARLAGGMALPLVARAKQPDIIHETYYSSSHPYPARTPVVTMVHDMIHEIFPDMAKDERTIENKLSSMHRADHILCNSFNTQKDLLAIYPQFAGKTSVTHLACDPVAEQTNMGAMHHRPFLLHVGGRGHYKNFMAIVRAFAKHAWLRDNFDLIHIAATAFAEHESREIAALGLDDVIHYRQANDAQLSAYYAQAELLVYPSLYEGFGLPPLEAMAASCPVVCFRTSSIPEVCGDAAQYGNVEHPESLVEAIRTVVSSNERKAELQNLGRKRAELFSWRKCAEQTAAVYRDLL